MAEQTVLYLHGLASSGRSTKACYLREKFGALPKARFNAPDFNPAPQDFEYMTTTGLIDRLRQYVLDHGLRDLSIIGSSYGGLIALHYAHRFGGVKKMLFLAPGLFWLSGGLSDQQLDQWEKAGATPVFHPAFEKVIPVRYDLQIDGLRYPEPIPPPSPLLIIHGQNDESVPIEHSRRYAADHPDRVRLIEVNANHDLNAHLDLVWEHVQSFVLGMKGVDA